jgi:hypothetical protein
MSLGKRASEYIAKTATSRGMSNENKNIFTGGGRSVSPATQVPAIKTAGGLKGPKVA